MNALSADTVSAIRTSWTMLAPEAPRIAPLFYERLFEIDPDIEQLFARTDMELQHERLIGALSAVVEAADTLGAAEPVLRALGARHARYGVLDDHYDSVASALMWTLEHVLAERFTPEIRSAWTVVYALVSGVMQQAADEIAQDAA